MNGKEELKNEIYCYVADNHHISTLDIIKYLLENSYTSYHVISMNLFIEALGQLVKSNEIRENIDNSWSAL